MKPGLHRLGHCYVGATIQNFLNFYHGRRYPPFKHHVTFSDHSAFSFYTNAFVSKCRVFRMVHVMYLLKLLMLNANICFSLIC